MDMTPQAYPLEAEDESDETYLVVGWTEDEDGGEHLRPVVVHASGSTPRPFVLGGSLTYRRPRETRSRAES